MPSLAYHNIFENGTVTADSEDASYPVENGYDWLTYPGDVWKPATSGTHYMNVDAGEDVDVDYLAAFSHDLDSITLQKSADGSHYADVTPSSSGADMQTDIKADDSAQSGTITGATSPWSSVEVLGQVSISSSVMTWAASSLERIRAAVMTTGESYEVTITVSSYSSGTLTVYAGAFAIGTITANGTYIFSGQANADYLQLGSSDFNGDCQVLKLTEFCQPNRVTHSHHFDNAAWTKEYLAVKPNVTGIWNGQRIAHKLIPSTDTQRHRLKQTITETGLLTISVDVKAAELGTCRLQLWNATDGTIAGAGVTLSGGILSNDTGTVSIERLRDGWYRVHCTGTATVTGTQFMLFVGSLTDATSTGDGISGIYASRAQITQSSGALPYQPTYTTAGAAITPEATEVIYRELDKQTAQYWRYKVVKASAASSLGVAAIGEKLTVPESVQVGFTPYSLAGDADAMNNESDGGYPLGRSLLRTGKNFALSFDLLTPAFIRGYWDVFVQHAEVKPFFFAWDYANYPNDVAFCWTADKTIPKPRYSRPNFFAVDLKLKART